jgi:hypothetical protein
MEPLRRNQLHATFSFEEACGCTQQDESNSDDGGDGAAMTGRSVSSGGRVREKLLPCPFCGGKRLAARQPEYGARHLGRVGYKTISSDHHTLAAALQHYSRSIARRVIGK